MESVLEIDASRIAGRYLSEDFGLPRLFSRVFIFLFHRRRNRRRVREKNTSGEQSAKLANDARFKQIAGCGDTSEVDSDSALTKITKNTKTIKGA